MAEYMAYTKNNTYLTGDKKNNIFKFKQTSFFYNYKTNKIEKRSAPSEFTSGNRIPTLDDMAGFPRAEKKVTPVTREIIHSVIFYNKNGKNTNLKASQIKITENCRVANETANNAEYTVPNAKQGFPNEKYNNTKLPNERCKKTVSVGVQHDSDVLSRKSSLPVLNSCKTCRRKFCKKHLKNHEQACEKEFNFVSMIFPTQNLDNIFGPEQTLNKHIENFVLNVRTNTPWIENKPAIPLIKCPHCKKLFCASIIEAHVRECRRKQRHALKLFWE